MNPEKISVLGEIASYAISLYTRSYYYYQRQKGTHLKSKLEQRNYTEDRAAVAL